MRGSGSGVLVLLGVALLLRSTALSVLATRGVVLDVLAFATVIWSLRRGETGGTLLGFVLGLAADLDAKHWLGCHALALSLVGYSAGRVGHTLVRDRARTHFVLLAFATAAHQAWAAAFEMSGAVAWGYLAQRVGLAVLATAPLGTLLVAIARRIHGRPLFPHGHLGTGTTG
jgi:rod shape-determining protein MreD